MKNKILAYIALTFLAGCMNSIVSATKYKEFDCSALITESNSFDMRETQLVIAQEQKIKTSQIQVFWWGFGQGDGIEASELANIRAEKKALKSMIETKNCKY